MNFSTDRVDHRYSSQTSKGHCPHIKQESAILHMRCVLPSDHISLRLKLVWIEARRFHSQAALGCSTHTQALDQQHHVAVHESSQQLLQQFVVEKEVTMGKTKIHEEHRAEAPGCRSGILRHSQLKQ